MPGGNTAYGHWFERPDGTKLPQGGNGVYDNRVGADWFGTLGVRILAGRGFDTRDRADADSFRGDLSSGNRSRSVSMDRSRRSNCSRSSGWSKTLFFSHWLKRPSRCAVRSISAFARKPVRLNASLARSPSQSARSIRTFADLSPAQRSGQLAIRPGATGGLVCDDLRRLALLLAALGLYGMTAHVVATRRLEIGIRMALGAAPRRVLLMVLARVGLLLTISLAIGTAGSVPAARFVRSMLYGVQPADPSTFLAAVIVLIAVAALASAIPAQRAARVDPASVLRDA
jgi:hypothetical protein